jgi:maltose/moltooligosaccharide transporter
MTPARSPLATLVPLFAIQFLSWAGMFCLWIYAVPVIAGDVFHSGSDPARYGTALATVGGCYALYAILAASLAFALPRALAQFGVRWVYGVGLLIGAAGIAALGMIDQVALLIPAFIAIGIGWSGVCTIPYGIVAAVAPEGRGAHLMRVFGFSTVVPQASMTLLLAFVGPRLTVASEHWVMVAGGGLMAAAGVLTLVIGGRFAVEQDEW